MSNCDSCAGEPSGGTRTLLPDFPERQAVAERESPEKAAAALAGSLAQSLWLRLLAAATPLPQTCESFSLLPLPGVVTDHSARMKLGNERRWSKRCVREFSRHRTTPSAAGTHYIPNFDANRPRHAAPTACLLQFTRSAPRTYYEQKHFVREPIPCPTALPNSKPMLPQKVTANAVPCAGWLWWALEPW